MAKSKKKEETASFVLRFTQKIFESKTGDPKVQWRGNIRHVQGGEEQRFSEFDEVIQFIQAHLAELTMQAIEDKSPEEQKGILSKSFDMWRQVAAAYPKRVLDTIKDPQKVLETLKDPKKQMAQFQEQFLYMKDGIDQARGDITDKIRDNISDKLELDTWRGVSKSDFKDMMKSMQSMSDEITKLSKKVDKLSKDKKTKK